MKSLRLPVPAPSRQMKLLFDNSRLEGVASTERDKIISVLARSSCRRPASGSRSLKMTSSE